MSLLCLFSSGLIACGFQLIGSCGCQGLAAVNYSVSGLAVKHVGKHTKLYFFICARCGKKQINMLRLKYRVAFCARLGFKQHGFMAFWKGCDRGKSHRSGSYDCPLSCIHCTVWKSDVEYEQISSSLPAVPLRKSFECINSSGSGEFPLLRKIQLTFKAKPRF